MIKRRMSLRGLIGALLLLMLLSPVLYLTWDRFYGAYVVHQACARDGGVRIFKRVHVAGFLNEFDIADDCRSCREQLRRDGFAFVDMHVKSEGNYIRTVRLDPGYYRLFLAPQGDPRCEWLRGTVDRRGGVDRLEDSGPCTAMIKLPSEPDEPTVFSVGKSFRQAGLKIIVNERTVTGSDPREVLGYVRDYRFTSLISRLLDEAGGGGNPDATCMTPRQRVDALRELPKRVLRSQDLGADDRIESTTN